MLDVIQLRLRSILSIFLSTLSWITSEVLLAEKNIAFVNSPEIQEFLSEYFGSRKMQLAKNPRIKNRIISAIKMIWIKLNFCHLAIISEELEIIHTD